MDGAAEDERAEWCDAVALDSRAFTRIFDRHRDAVFRQALRLLLQPADAEEVASAAFFELWRKRESVVLVGGSVRPWLLVTVANLARNSHRTRLRREAFLHRLTREHTDESGRLFERVDEEALRSELANALARLKPVDVALVTLTALEGYPVVEVADILGLSAGTARVRLHRAHVRLRGLLRPPHSSRIDSQEVAP